MRCITPAVYDRSKERIRRNEMQVRVIIMRRLTEQMGASDEENTNRGIPYLLVAKKNEVT
jgi:hypothetical protein